MSLVSGAVMLELLQLLLGPNSIMRGASSWFFFLKALCYYTAAEKKQGPLRQRGETLAPLLL